MQSELIESWDDPRLAPYRNLKDKELEKKGGRFIAEGQNVVQRLLRSKFEVESVLIARRKYDAIVPFAADRAKLLIASDDLIERVIGFEFHSGVLACGISPASPRLESVLPPPPLPALVVVCQEITNPENLGSLIRASAAFGADAMVLGERCCNPFFRQSVRVSMGAVFSLPMVCSKKLETDSDVLKNLGCEVWATVLAEDAARLQDVRRPPRVAVVLGNEAQGLDAQTIEKCDKRVTIPMQRGTDSLNVTVAAAVVLYQMSIT
jgi:tRNA G18 (ribose-2'-O)-methylase SpoU